MRTAAILFVTALLLSPTTDSAAQAALCEIPRHFARGLDQLRDAAARGEYELWSRTATSLEGVTVGPRITCADRAAQTALALELLYGPGNGRRITTAIGHLEVATFDPVASNDRRFSSDATPPAQLAASELAYALALSELSNELGGHSPVTISPATNTWSEWADEASVARRAVSVYRRALDFIARARGATALSLLLSESQIDQNWQERTNPQEATLLGLVYCAGLADWPRALAPSDRGAFLLRLARQSRGAPAQALLRCAVTAQLTSGVMVGAVSCESIPLLTVLSERNRCERAVLSNLAGGGEWRQVIALSTQLLSSLELEGLTNLSSDDLKIARYDLMEVARNAAFASAQVGDWGRAVALNDLRTALSLQNWARMRLAMRAAFSPDLERFENSGPSQLIIFDSAHGCVIALLREDRTTRVEEIDDEVCSTEGSRSIGSLRALWNDYVRDTRSPWSRAEFERAIGDALDAVTAGGGGDLSVLLSDWAGNLPLLDAAWMSQFNSVAGAVYGLPFEMRREESPALGTVRVLVHPELRYAGMEARFIGSALPPTSSFEIISSYDGSRFPEGFRGASVWHLATHAFSANRIATQSRIALPDNSSLSLSELRFGLRRLTHDQIPSLVVLSACDTALGSYESINPSLANAFLDRGVEWVVASTWPVSDMATALLMHRFYEELREGEAVPRALGAAQLWLASASFEQIQATIVQSGLRLSQAQQDDIDALGETPFADPIYWAAFRAYSR